MWLGEAGRQRTQLAHSQPEASPKPAVLWRQPGSQPPPRSPKASFIESYPSVKGDVKGDVRSGGASHRAPSPSPDLTLPAAALAQGAAAGVYPSSGVKL